MKNIFDFLEELKVFISDKTNKDIWVYSGHTHHGSLLIKNLMDKRKIIFKPSDSTLPIGGKRIQDFITKTPTFKGHSIDNYIFVAHTYKHNAEKLTIDSTQLTLISVDFINENILVFGSKNINSNLLNHIIEFANHLKYSISYNLEGLLKHQAFNKKENNYKEVNTRTNETEIITENGYWKEYNTKYPNFKYVLAISITFLVIYFAVIINKSGDTNNVYEPKNRSTEIIYTEIKEALSNGNTDKCKSLYYEMIINHTNSVLFDSVKSIYDSAIVIEQVKKEVNKRMKNNKTNSTKNNEGNSGKNNKVNSIKKTEHKKINKSLNVSAQAYSDGTLSCNVYLVDKSGNIYYLDASSISYTIYSSNGLLNATGKISTSNTNSGLYIDIPLGTHIFEAKSVSFIINTSSGVTYKSNKVFIDY